MSEQSREFQVFIKPVGARCNLNCQYCYYLDKAGLYKHNGFVRMPDEILKKYIIGLIEASTDQVICFSWHGGEPVLAGLDFFRKVVDLQKKYKPLGCSILNGLQSNATLLNDEWCKFLAEENFMVGVSIDGPEEMHNKFRISEDNKGSFKKTLDGYLLLKKYKIQTEILTVVNAENVNFPREVYRFLRELGSDYLTFLPLVERDHGSEAGASTISVEPETWGAFLCTVFDEWIGMDLGKIKIQIIEEAARTAFDQEHTLCIFKKTCGGVPVVERNGDFYSCDHFVDEDHLIGNISETSLADMLECDSQIKFGQVKFGTLPEYCLGCEVKNMCNGECPKNRFIKTPAGERGLNYLCAGYKRFFTHIKPFVDAIAEEWRKDR